MNNKLFNKDWVAKVNESLFTTVKPTSEQRLYEKVDGGYKLTVKGEKPDGSIYEWGYEAVKDGEPFPVYGRPDVDSIIAHKVTDEITIGEFYKDGKIVAFYRRGMPVNGESLTVTFGGLDNENKPYFDVIEYN